MPRGLVRGRCQVWGRPLALLRVPQEGWQSLSQALALLTPGHGCFHCFIPCLTNSFRGQYLWHSYLHNMFNVHFSQYFCSYQFCCLNSLSLPPSWLLHSRSCFWPPPRKPSCLSSSRAPSFITVCHVSACISLPYQEHLLCSSDEVSPGPCRQRDCSPFPIPSDRGLLESRNLVSLDTFSIYIMPGQGLPMVNAQEKFWDKIITCSFLSWPRSLCSRAFLTCFLPFVPLSPWLLI